MLAGWRPARLDQYLEPESPALHLGQDRRGNPQLPRPISRTNFRRTTLVGQDLFQVPRRKGDGSSPDSGDLPAIYAGYPDLMPARDGAMTGMPAGGRAAGADRPVTTWSPR